nr:cutinase family protein [Melanopsichium pennsylvanicum 4]
MMGMGMGGDSSGGDGGAAGGCPPLYLVFARGTFEVQGTLGIVGRPLCNGLKQQVAGTECYDVVYTSDAEYMISPEQGGQVATQFISGVASRCANTKFVLGGYSKGGMVVHSIRGQRVVGAVTFGDPLKAQTPPATSNYKTFCHLGDPVCLNGMNVMAHLTYGTEDIGTAVQFLVQAYRSSGGGAGGAAKGAGSGGGAADGVSGGGGLMSMLDGGSLGGGSGGGLGGNGLMSMFGGRGI